MRGEIEEADGKRRLETAALPALRRAEAKRPRLVRRAAAVEAARLSAESVRAARSAVGCAEVSALRAFVREQARRSSCLPESRHVASGVEVSLREREGRRGKDSARQASLNSFYAARALHGRCPWAGASQGVRGARRARRCVVEARFAGACVGDVAVRVVSWWLCFEPCFSGEGSLPRSSGAVSSTHLTLPTTREA